MIPKVKEYMFILEVLQGNFVILVVSGDISIILEVIYYYYYYYFILRFQRFFDHFVGMGGI